MFSQPTPSHLINGQRSRFTFVFPWIALLPCVFSAVVLATACGQVITLTPTPTVAPTATLDVSLAVATLPPTSTPAPYTPEPTSTATVSPTPILHEIQSGESLLSIAGKYGISISALQETNGILDPRTLQIGQQLIIPRPEEIEEGDSAFSTPTPTPLAMTVENVFLSDTTIGGLFVLGEVNNVSGQSLEQVRVGVTLVDADGKELAKADSFVALDLVETDQHAPFAILFGETPPDFSKFQAYVLHSVPAYVGSYYRDLEVRSLSTESERYASYTVSGSVFNFGPEDTVDVQVVITAYDSLGRVIATRKVQPEYNVIGRGGETKFRAVLAPVGGPVERIEAVAQGRRQQK